MGVLSRQREINNLLPLIVSVCNADLCEVLIKLICIFIFHPALI